MDYLSRQLDDFIMEMVDCGAYPFVNDVFITKTHSVFVFKKTVPNVKIKTLQVLFKNKITIFNPEGIYLIVL